MTSSTSRGCRPSARAPHIHCNEQEESSECARNSTLTLCLRKLGRVYMELDKNTISRRQFLAASAAGAALASLPTWFSGRAEAAEADQASARPSKFGPNDQLNLAVIGPGGSRGGFRQGLHDTHAI